MARARTTFGKLERDRGKQEKQRAKQEKREARAESSGDPQPEGPKVDESKILAELAEIHRRFDDHEMSFEDFEARREELTRLLTI